MCKLSSRLTLCTCAGEVTEDGNYWVLHRFDPGKRNFIMGEPMMPDFIEPAAETFNRTLLLSHLNEGNAFDVELNPKNKDRLLISVLVGEGKRINYGFVYTRKKWLYEAYDPFEWCYRHGAEKSGEIKNAVQ